MSINQAGVKLRFLAKRGKARKDRVEALKAEKKDMETQEKSTKVCSCFCFIGHTEVGFECYAECEVLG